MAIEPTPEDMAAAKKQGDLVELVLAAGGRSRKRPKTDGGGEAAPAGVPDYGPHHRPGAWPFGLAHPGPNTCHPDCGCAIKPRPVEEP